MAEAMVRNHFIRSAHPFYPPLSQKSACSLEQDVNTHGFPIIPEILLSVELRDDGHPALHSPIDYFQGWLSHTPKHENRIDCAIIESCLYKL